MRHIITSWEKLNLGLVVLSAPRKQTNKQTNKQTENAVRRVLRATTGVLPDTPLEAVEKPDIIDGLVTVAVAKGIDLEEAGSTSTPPPSAEDFETTRDQVLRFQADTERNPKAFHNLPDMDKVKTYLDEQQLTALQQELQSSQRRPTLLKRGLRTVRESATGTKVLGGLTVSDAGLVVTCALADQPVPAFFWGISALVNIGTIIYERNNSKSINNQQIIDMRRIQSQINTIEARRQK